MRTYPCIYTTVGVHVCTLSNARISMYTRTHVRGQGLPSSSSSSSSSAGAGPPAERAVEARPQETPTRNRTLNPQDVYRFLAKELDVSLGKTIESQETQGTLEGSRVLLGMIPHCTSMGGAKDTFGLLGLFVLRGALALPFGRPVPPPSPAGLVQLSAGAAAAAAPAPSSAYPFSSGAAVRLLLRRSFCTCSA